MEGEEQETKGRDRRKGNGREEVTIAPSSWVWHCVAMGVPSLPTKLPVRTNATRHLRSTAMRPKKLQNCGVDSGGGGGQRAPRIPLNTP